MRVLFALIAGVVLSTVAAPVLAGAAKQPPPLSIAANPNQLTFGQSSTISGQLGGASHASKQITLWQSPSPFTKFTKLQIKKTDANGNFSFTAQPNLNTKYHVRSRTSPVATSPDVLVKVAIRVSIVLGDATPKAGQAVRFSGSLFPPHDDSRVCIQRQTRKGSYRAVACTTAKHVDASRSSYSRRVKVTRDGVFRTYVFGDADHTPGRSRARRVSVH